MYKTRAALAAMATLLVAGCGLQGDLYIPTEKPAVAPAEGQSTGDQSTDNENAEEEPDPSSEQVP